MSHTITIDSTAHASTLIASAILIFKFVATTFIQGGKRFPAGTRPPEDGGLGNLARGKKQSFGLDKDEKVEDAKLKKALEADLRWQRIVLNDLENIPFALIIAWGSLLSAKNPFLHSVLVYLYCVVRILHTISYANGLQPHRAIMYGLGVFSVAGLIANGIAGVLSK